MTQHRFLFDKAKFPNNPTLLREVNEAAEQLQQKLRNLDVSKLDISAYNKEYFGGLVNHLEATLQFYTYILIGSLANSKKRKEDFVFLDYGAGSGMLCLLAKQYGIGTVVYNDIYDVSLNDAKVIGEAICLPADHYILGDVPETLSYLATRSLSCDCVSTHDVVEHIYNVEDFFEALPKFSKGPLTIFNLTVANPLNPFVASRLKKIQVTLETTDREPEWWHKGRDSLMSYLSLRRKIIQDYLQETNQSMSQQKVTELAQNTRGLMKKDILKAVDQFLAKGTLPPAPKHPTNTCDPLTGNRAENLVDPKNYLQILKKGGFQAQARGSYYWRSPSKVKRPFLQFLNWLIARTGYRGLHFAPALIVVGYRK